MKQVRSSRHCSQSVELERKVLHQLTDAVVEVEDDVRWPDRPRLCDNARFHVIQRLLAGRSAIQVQVTPLYSKG